MPFVKKIKLGLDTTQLDKDLEKLRKKREALDEERSKIEQQLEYSKYKQAQEDYNKQRKELERLKKIKKSERTEEETKQIERLEKSTSKYSDYMANLNSLFDIYKTYGSTDKTKEYDELFGYLERIEEIQSKIQETDEEALGVRARQREAAQAPNKFKQQTQESFKNLASGIKEKLVSVFDSFNDQLKKTLTKAIEEYQNIASYSLSTSLKMNQEAREQALMYGLSDAQNYALTKAMEEIGAGSVEDLYWMTEAQQERFSERIGYWTGQYNALADKNAFKTLEQLQAELNDIKTDFQMEVVQFVANNKETIIWTLKTGVSILQKIMDGLAWLIGTTPESGREGALSDAINNYSTSNNSQTNVKIDNSFNGVSTDNLSKLRKAGNEVNRQLIKALNG